MSRRQVIWSAVIVSAIVRLGLLLAAGMASAHTDTYVLNFSTPGPGPGVYPTNPAHAPYPNPDYWRLRSAPWWLWWHGERS